jgi:mono/diheme cytochrome c family protein
LNVVSVYSFVAFAPFVTLLVLAAPDAHTQTPEARGAEVYAEQKCGLCHSVAGVGSRRGALDGIGSKLTEEEIRLWIVDATGMTERTKATRRPNMRDYKLPPNDLTALVSYLASLKKS